MGERKIYDNNLISILKQGKSSSSQSLLNWTEVIHSNLKHAVK